MLTYVYIKWVPLLVISGYHCSLVISGGTGMSAGLVVAFAVTIAFVKQTG